MSNVTNSYINNPQPSPRIKSDNAAGGKVDPAKLMPVPQSRGKEIKGIR